MLVSTRSCRSNTTANSLLTDGHCSIKYQFLKFQVFSLLITYFKNKKTLESSEDIKKYFTKFNTKFCDVFYAQLLQNSLKIEKLMILEQSVTITECGPIQGRSS